MSFCIWPKIWVFDCCLPSTPAVAYLIPGWDITRRTPEFSHLTSVINRHCARLSVLLMLSLLFCCYFRCKFFVFKCKSDYYNFFVYLNAMLTVATVLTLSWLTSLHFHCPISCSKSSLYNVSFVCHLWRWTWNTVSGGLSQGRARKQTPVLHVRGPSSWSLLPWVAILGTLCLRYQFLI